ncbi:MAG TPA: UvrD-helicase domain-containing protein [Streptosporangiaceae bacterium]|nr:UvrD-helicase domain-containing protein [Streptosporangiaceae bacterium]
MFRADLHIHSRFSRACSKNCDIEHLAWWARRKGITVVGTGDFTHPAWTEELAESLIPAEPGLFRLRAPLEDQLRRTSPPSCTGEVRFMLSSEISTIYRRGDRTRKVHHLLYAPDFAAAGRITAALSKIGNLASDGRPILGLDSRDLLEIVLDSGPGSYLVPAHVWTPWFAVLGSKSGFDLVADCYGDLASEIFAIETGLSSDPAMNWRCSVLDGYRLVSNSDAHSPPMLGREATTFGTELDYFAMADGLRTGNGLIGTIEFFPEEGKYHLDGHRKCGVQLEPGQTRSHGGDCPRCGRPLTVGVLNRVTELADRPEGYRPDGAPESVNLVSLPQIVGEVLGAGPQSKKVTAEVTRLVAALGPELDLLTVVPASELSRVAGSPVAEAIARLRRGEVVRTGGFDGEYGTVRLFGPGELTAAGALFDLPSPRPAPDAQTPAAQPGGEPAGAGRGGPGLTGQGLAGPGLAGPGDLMAADPGPGDPGPNGGRRAAAGLEAALDPDQRAAVSAASPLMIIAGPGTGKTRTLAYRIAGQIARGVPAGACLAVTFTRRAAGELRARLDSLVPGSAGQICVTTFHGLGLLLLREHPERAGLTPEFSVADEATVAEVAAGLAGSARAGRRLLTEAATDPGRRAELTAALRARDLVDFDGLIELAAGLLRDDPGLAARMRERWPRISVDEYQDIDAAQYELLALLAGDGAGLTVIGDPDQAIYGFRGADVGFFLRFSQDYPGAVTCQLTRNYRATAAIVAGATAVIAPATLAPGRALHAVSGPGAPITLHESADEAAEASWIAASVDRLLGGVSLHSIDSGRADGYAADGVSLRDVAVLYRTDGQAAALGRALGRAGLPYQKASHDLLARRTGVPELVAELRRAATGPPDGAAARSDVAERLRAAVRRLTAGASPGRATDLRSAAGALTPLARRCGDDLTVFLAEIALGAQADALDPRADAVTLLTLHAAKGLEFDVVFLAGCERGLLPLWIPGQAATAAGTPAATAASTAAGTTAGDPTAEERRLLFVGMTRARSRLYLTYAAQRARRGAIAGGGGPSPFLAGIGPDLLRRPQAPRPRRADAQQLRLL